MLSVIEEKPNNIPLPSAETAVEELFRAGAHIGYSKSRMHPKMKPFIFCTRSGVEVFNLEKTEKQIRAAEARLNELGKEKASVIWVGAKAPAKSSVKAAGVELGAPYAAKRWLGGTFTNFKVLEERMAYLDKLEKESESGEFSKYVKKERLAKANEMNKLKSMFEGLRVLKSIPKAAVIVDPKEEKTAFSEARKKAVEIIAVMNNDCSPDGIQYPIAANDNSSAAIALILTRLAAAYANGVKEYKHKEEK